MAKVTHTLFVDRIPHPPPSCEMVNLPKVPAPDHIDRKPIETRRARYLRAATNKAARNEERAVPATISVSDPFELAGRIKRLPTPTTFPRGQQCNRTNSLLFSPPSIMAPEVPHGDILCDDLADGNLE